MHDLSSLLDANPCFLQGFGGYSFLDCTPREVIKEKTAKCDVHVYKIYAELTRTPQNGWILLTQWFS